MAGEASPSGRSDMASPDVQLYYRPLAPPDLSELKSAHAALFPINYEDNFFQKVVYHQERIFSWGAVAYDAARGAEALVGFATARTLHVHEMEAADRHHMQLSGSCYDSEFVVYVLTLGVLPGYRRRGLARGLVRLVVGAAQTMSATSVFLHVVTYNTNAQALYARCGFSRAGPPLIDFYHLATGRQPDPQRTRYDALLYVLHLHPPPTMATTARGHTLSALAAAAAANDMHVQEDGNYDEYNGRASFSASSSSSSSAGGAAAAAAAAAARAVVSARASSSWGALSFPVVLGSAAAGGLRSAVESAVAGPLRSVWASVFSACMPAGWGFGAGGVGSGQTTRRGSRCRRGGEGRSTTSSSSPASTLSNESSSSSSLLPRQQHRRTGTEGGNRDGGDEEDGASSAPVPQELRPDWQTSQPRHTVATSAAEHLDHTHRSVGADHTSPAAHRKRHIQPQQQQRDASEGCWVAGGDWGRSDWQPWHKHQQLMQSASSSSSSNLLLLADDKAAAAAAAYLDSSAAALHHKAPPHHHTQYPVLQGSISGSAASYSHQQRRGSAVATASGSGGGGRSLLQRIMSVGTTAREPSAHVE